MPDEKPPRDRDAYLQEQMDRQQRGEPIDVEWVQAELDRVRRVARDKLASSEKRLRWLVIFMAVLFVVFWLAGNLIARKDPWAVAPVILIVGLAVWGIRMYRKR
jgi:type VI protein secretion system component VasK